MLDTDAPAIVILPIDPDTLDALRRFFDPETLRAWIAEHEHKPGRVRAAQVATWREYLAILEANA